MICCKDKLDLDFILTLYIVSKCSTRGQEAAPEDTVGRGWRAMWVYAGLDERDGERRLQLCTQWKGEGVRSKAKCSYVGGGGFYASCLIA
jgi:hypothetical protein